MNPLSHSTKTGVESVVAGRDSLAMPRMCCALSANKTGKTQPHTGALAVEFMARIECTWHKTFSRVCAAMLNRWLVPPALQSN